MPAPARSAASQDRHAAPVEPGRAADDEHRSRRVYLLSLGRRRGTSSRTLVPTRPLSRARRGRAPMSATSTSPAWKRPGATTRPSFTPWNVTVADARTATPATSPVDASMPDGTSTETTGSPTALIISIAAAASRLGAPVKPVPKSASTTTSARPASARKATPTSRARRRFSSGIAADRAARRRAGAPRPHGLPRGAAAPRRARRRRWPPARTRSRRGARRGTGARRWPPRPRRLAPSGRAWARSTPLRPPASPRPCRAARASSRLAHGTPHVAVLDGADRGRQLLRVRHRQVDAAGLDPLRPCLRRAREAHLRLRPAHDLDLLPGEPDTAAERLADRLLAGEAGRVVLGGMGARVAVGDLGLGEDALAEAGVALERRLDARDLDQVDPDPHGRGESDRHADAADRWSGIDSR